MPMYEFERESGELFEEFMHESEFEERVKDGFMIMPDGSRVKYRDDAWFRRSVVSTCPSNYPMTCTAIGVHPSQVKEHMEHLRAMGCGQVNHTKDGDVIFESKSQRKKVCEALGFFDRNGGYSDPQPKNMTSATTRQAKSRRR